VRSLVDAHNGFVESFGGTVGEGAPAAAASSSIASLTTAYRISTTLLRAEHLIDYDVESTLLPALHRFASVSVRYGEGRTVRYDFAELEHYLSDEVLSGKPFLELEVAKFPFAGETRLSGALAALRARIPQTQLNPTLLVSLRAQFSADATQLDEVHSAVEMCIGFLSSMGATHLASVPKDVPIVEYATQTLSLTTLDNKLLPDTLHLEHLCALWDLLGDLSTVDQMQSVLSSFKEPLMESQRAALAAAVEKLDLPQLLPTFKDFLLNQLNENTSLGPQLSLSAVLSYCPLLPTHSTELPAAAAPVQEAANAEEDLPDLGDLPWFTENFPNDLHLCHAVACYEYLVECEQLCH